MGMRVSNRSFFALYAVLGFYFALYLVPNQFLGVRASTIARNETDLLALLEFKSKITQDPLGALGSWNASIHFCNWHGIACSRRHHQRVTILDLRSLKLAGSISPHIGNLSFLKVLVLQNSSFTHQIPAEVGRLRRLQILGLDNNTIGGEIPASISSCSNLIRIDLYHNQLAGKIPSELGSLSKIKILYLDFNNLTGSIPPSLGNLSSLREIAFDFNNLAGSIPDSFGWLKNVVELDLVGNRLSGTIPSSIFNISSINVFDAGVNQIEGRIPLDIGFTLPNLQWFNIATNQITGVIPSSISNASKMESFQVSENKLTGDVPDLAKLQRLYRFTIDTNNLGSGVRHDLNFLCSLTNATSLKQLDIHSNNFEGLLPGCINNFSTTLEMLHLSTNKIFGSIPVTPQNLPMNTQG